MSSLYAQYLKERTNGECLEIEHAFATYHFVGTDSLYIEDVYVVPEYRRSRKSTELWNKIVEIAKQKGITKILGSVDLSLPSRDVSIKWIYERDMRISHVQNNMLYFIKEVN